MICEGILSNYIIYDNMIKTITPHILHDWLTRGDVTLIDVRETDEFNAGHIESALLHPLSSFHQNFTDVPTGRVVFQCRSGKRSDTACRMVQELAPDHTELYNLEGGILAWASAGLPVTT